MAYIPPYFSAGQHDFDSRYDPSSDKGDIQWQKSFSVGIFEYVLKKDLIGLKRGPVKVRVHGHMGALKPVLAIARQIRDDLDRGVYRGPKRVTVRENANLRRRINQKAHALALAQYDTIHDLVETLVTDNLKCNASESACEDYIERFASSMSGATLVNTYDLYQLARQTTSLLDQAGEALSVIHRLEQHTGLKLYFRNESAGLPDSLCKKVFAAVQQYASEQAVNSSSTEKNA